MFYLFFVSTRNCKNLSVDNEYHLCENWAISNMSRRAGWRSQLDPLQKAHRQKLSPHNEDRSTFGKFDLAQIQIGGCFSR
jgi:hypothetical protein